MTTTEYSRSLSYEMDKKEESVLFLGKKYKLNNIFYFYFSPHLVYSNFINFLDEMTDFPKAIFSLLILSKFHMFWTNLVSRN